jgi:hypothetical protein
VNENRANPKHPILRRMHCLPELSTRAARKKGITPQPQHPARDWRNRYPPPIPMVTSPRRQSTNYLFYSTDTSLLIDGLRHDFLVLAIPDPSHDSTIGALVSAGFNMAPFLLAELHQLRKTGVVIDLRLSGAGPTVRQDYQVTSSFLKETNLPIVFLWDRDAAGRAAFFSQFLEQFPGITWSLTRDRPRYQSDCFKDVHPSF